MKNKHNFIPTVCFILAGLVAISILLSLFTSLYPLESLRIIFGSVYVLFLPGFIISYLFFPKTKPFEQNKGKIERKKPLGVFGKGKGTIDWIERIALSFALSIAIVPLTVFYLNLIGIKINLLNSFLTILGIIVISLGIVHWKVRKK